MNLDLAQITDYVARFFLAVLLGVMISFRRKMTQSDLYVVQAHAFLATAGAMFMAIIGEQLFRAIGLLAAAGVVRYRYAIRNPRDASTLVIALALGMACGSGLLTLALLGGVFMMVVTYVLDRFPQLLIFPRIHMREQMVLSVTTRDYDATMRRFAEVFKRNDITYVLRSFSEKTSEQKAGMSGIDMVIEYPAEMSLSDLTFQLTDENIVRIAWEEIKAIWY